MTYSAVFWHSHIWFAHWTSSILFNQNKKYVFYFSLKNILPSYLYISILREKYFAELHCKKVRAKVSTVINGKWHCFTVKQTARTGGAVQTGALRKSPGPGTVGVVLHFQLTSAPIVLPAWIFSRNWKAYFSVKLPILDSHNQLKCLKPTLYKS